MHELGITKELIRISEDTCREKNIKQPKQINISLGLLTTYSKESLMFYFNLLKKENPLISSTKLNISEIPGLAHCNNCKKDSKITNPFILACSHCNSFNIDIKEGKDFKVISIDS